jgi:hypothetical protein
MAVKSLIETVTVGAGGAASIEFTDIPQDGSDLVLAVSSRLNLMNVTLSLRVNSNTSSIYTDIYLQGNGASASSANLTASYLNVGVTSISSDTANTFGNANFYFPNYTSVANKSFSGDSVSETNGTYAYQRIVAGLLATTSPITSVAIAPIGFGAYIFEQHSTASLYKIKYD